MPKPKLAADIVPLVAEINGIARKVGNADIQERVKLIYGALLKCPALAGLELPDACIQECLAVIRRYSEV